MSSRILRVESLERRDTPATVGNPWADSTALTLSFADDGIEIGDLKSLLSKTMNKAGNDEVWQREILRAFQTWAVQTNANIAVVDDEKLAFGTPGERQGDLRFGDIRIGAAPISNDSLANAVPPDAGIGTWSGDVVFNSRKKFAIDPTSPNVGYDLYTTTLHEAGHVFGLDHSSDPDSALGEEYAGTMGGLSANDIANLRAIYGNRTTDRYEGSSGNETFETATVLSREPYQVLTADLTTIGDRDVFTFVVPAGADKASITLGTAGISSVIASIEVYDADGRLIERSRPTDPLEPKDISLDFEKLKKEVRYYARVSSPSSDAFAIGRYVLTLNLDDTKVGTGSKAIEDRGTNETTATASTMPVSRGGNNDRFGISAKLEGKSDVDVYRLSAPTIASGEALELEVRNLKGDRPAPEIRVYDNTGTRLAVQVLESNGSKMTYQVLGITRGATYFVEVRSPDRVDASGDYRLQANFDDAVSTGLSQLDSGSLSSVASEVSGTLVLDSARLVQFSLVVDKVPFGATVALQVIDSRGDVLGEWFVNPLTGQVNGSIFLNSGTYSVVASMETKKGQAVPTLRYWLFGGVSSDPIGPVAPGTGTLPTKPGPSVPPPPPPPPTYTYKGSATTVPVGYAYKS